jgi:hypothetical protein
MNNIEIKAERLHDTHLHQEVIDCYIGDEYRSITIDQALKLVWGEIDRSPLDDLEGYAQHWQQLWATIKADALDDDEIAGVNAELDYHNEFGVVIKCWIRNTYTYLTLAEGQSRDVGLSRLNELPYYDEFWEELWTAIERQIFNLVAMDDNTRQAWVAAHQEVS